MAVRSASDMVSACRSKIGRSPSSIWVPPGNSMRDMTTDTGSVPDRARVRLPGISSRAYEHPADRSALTAMRKLTGFDVLLRRLAGLFSDRSLRLMFLASGVRVNEGQFRELHDMLRDGAYVLDLPDVPELFVTQNPMVNAMTLGSDRPFMVITTGMLDLYDAEELRFTIGHELGHVLSGHAVYRTMLFHLINLARRVAWMPLGYLGLRAIIWALEEWYRKSELSADAFHEQAREYDAVPDVREGLIKLLQLQGTLHPFAVVRFAEIDRWARDGAYERILGGEYPRRSEDGQASVSEEVRAAARSYQESWSRTSDPFIGLVRGVAEGAVGAGERLFGRFGRRDDDQN